MTDAEWQELSASRVVTPDRTLAERLLGLVKWSVVLAFCLGMAGACYLGSTGVTGLTRAITLAGMGLFGLGAVAALWMGLRELLPGRDRVIPPQVRDRSAVWHAVEFDALEAWRIDTGDDDVPTLLVRLSEGRYVSMYGQVLDEFWEDEDDDAWQSIGSTMRIESIGAIARVESRGPRIALRACELAEPWPTRGTPWWAQAFVELTDEELGAAWMAALKNAARQGK